MSVHHQEPVVLYDSPEAATYRTDIKGWVSRHGRYCGDGESGERCARYDGSTHRKCQDCDNLAGTKSYLICEDCRSKQRDAKFEAMALVPYTGQVLTLHDGDDYFFDLDEVYTYADTYDLKVSELQLVVCRPNCARRIEADLWADDFAEDHDPPDWLVQAINRFNAEIAAHQGSPLSWSPGDKERVAIPDDPEELPA